MVPVSVPTSFGVQQACLQVDTQGRVLGVDASGRFAYMPAFAPEPAPTPRPEPAKPPVDPKTRMLAEHIYDTMVEKKMLGSAHLVVDVYMEVWKDLCGDQAAHSSRAAVERFHSFLEACPDLFECFHASVGVTMPNAKGEMLVRLVPGRR
jgi:hypothetical protein